jgi:PAS domain S-box-containing protein
MAPETRAALLARIQDLQARLDEAEETLRALRSGEVDAVVASGPAGDRVYTLKGADEPYRIMVQDMAEGALTLTPEGLILFSNDQFASIVGVPLERVIGASMYSFTAAEDAPMLSALLTGGGKTKAELRLKKAPAQLSASALSLEGTRCVCLIVTDLTEQKRNQEIIAAERLARSILDQAAGALVVVDPAGRIIRASRAAERFASGAMLLRQFDEVFCLRSKSETKDYTLAEILSTAEREGSISSIEAAARRPDGEVLDVLVSASVLSGADSERLGSVILVSDVSGLRRAENALRESESRLRTLSDNLPEGAIYRLRQDAGGKLCFEFITAGIESLTGVPAAEIMRDADSVNSAIRPEDIERLKAEMARSREDLTRFEMEVRHRHRQTGEERWSLLRAVPSCRPDGSTVWEGIQLDITDRKRAEAELRAREEQLRQAQKMESIGVLAGGIAHDFNNLLTGVIGNASLALEEMPARDRNRPAIEAVMTSASKAADLTRQLLAYAGKGRFIVGPLNLSRSVRDMVDLLRGSVPATIGIDLDLQQDIPPVEADAGQIQQIIMNLVLNASEAIGDRPGQIAIQTRTRSLDAAVIERQRLKIPEGTYVCLEVQDTGSGMDEATQARIFEPFFTTKFTGRGLGLAAVHGIVRAHKGAVLVYSHPGHGAHFTVLLPVAGSGPSQQAQITARVQDLYGQGTVLVVDDEETVRTVAKAALEKFGYRVLLARNGIDAVEIFTQVPDQVTVVLLDLTMPLMSGEETLRRLRAIRPDVPVLLSSGYNQIEVIRRFTGQVFAGFIGKPYSAATLVGKIKSVCAALSA